MSEAFEAVHPELRPALERLGFTALTAVQARVLDAESDGRNLRISSQTGSGKTVAIGLVLAKELVRAAEEGVRGPVAAIVAPTRELAAQVEQELRNLYQDVAGLHTTVVTGGTDIGRERRELRRGALMLVGTPGRMLDHVRSGALDFTRVQHLVLDEADQMLDMGFKDELDAIVDEVPEGAQRHLVSATFGDGVQRFADRFQPEALRIEGTRLGEANSDIQHIAYTIHARDRYPALVNCLLAIEEGRCLIFVARRVDAADLAEHLAEDGFSALPFSGDLSQTQRTRTLNAFRTGIVKTLVATDVAARGIDVSDIRTVIHFDLPMDSDTYTHRSGRTGRAGQTGRSLVVVPVGKENRTRWLFRGAKVDAEWHRVPSAKKIRKAHVKRTRRELHDRLSAERELTDSERAYAADLLEQHEPAKLLSCLLDMACGKLPREPMIVRTYEPRQEIHFKPRSRPPRGRATGRRAGGRGGRSGPRGPRGRRRSPR